MFLSAIYVIEFIKVFTIHESCAETYISEGIGKINIKMQRHYVSIQDKSSDSLLVLYLHRLGFSS